MTTMVCFTAADVHYAVSVDAAVAVRPSDGVVALPGQDTDVVGVLPGDPVISVISPLNAGADARHVLVITTARCDYGLLVDAVTDVSVFDDATVQPAPPGQQDGLIAGVAERSNRLVLIADPDALAARV